MHRPCLQENVARTTSQADLLHLLPSGKVTNVNIQCYFCPFMHTASACIGLGMKISKTHYKHTTPGKEALVIYRNNSSFLNPSRE